MKLFISASGISTDKYKDKLVKYNYDGKYIEINTLEELFRIVEDVGLVIVDEDSIEIYDTFRESW